MPFSIYISVSSHYSLSIHHRPRLTTCIGKKICTRYILLTFRHLPVMLCHFYCLLDVSASTSSIVHLVLISIDRLVAATKPAEYKTLKHRRRVYGSIVFAWLFSGLLALPLGKHFKR